MRVFPNMVLGDRQEFIFTGAYYRDHQTGVLKEWHIYTETVKVYHKPGLRQGLNTHHFYNKNIHECYFFNIHGNCRRCVRKVRSSPSSLEHAALPQPHSENREAEQGLSGPSAGIAEFADRGHLQGPHESCGNNSQEREWGTAHKDLSICRALWDRLPGLTNSVSKRQKVDIFVYFYCTMTCRLGLEGKGLHSTFDLKARGFTVSYHSPTDSVSHPILYSLQAQ